MAKSPSIVLFLLWILSMVTSVLISLLVYAHLNKGPFDGWIFTCYALGFLSPFIVAAVIELGRAICCPNDEDDDQEFEFAAASVEEVDRDEAEEDYIKAQIAAAAMRALPPVESFQLGDIETGSLCDQCVICIEEFKNGELVQPLKVCVHVFHYSCINSWLHGGNTSCPLCRQELSI